jgi:hypothetical protein
MTMRRIAVQKDVALAVIALAVAIFGTTPASALTLDTVSGSWSNVVGGTNVGFYTVGDEVQVRWGDPGNGAQSGLGFTPEPPPPVVFDVGTPFEIGTLRHFNNVVAPGTPASSADLTIVLDFDDPDLAPLGQTFSLSVNETLNSGICPVGSPPCADIIEFPSAFSDETFEILGVSHTLEILGFRTGDEVVHQFISAEGGTNSAVLVGRISASPPIPEPTAAVMFGAGFLLVARSLRRGRRAMEA